MPVLHMTLAGHSALQRKLSGGENGVVCREYSKVLIVLISYVFVVCLHVCLLVCLFRCHTLSRQLYIRIGLLLVLEALQIHMYMCFYVYCRYLFD